MVGKLKGMRGGERRAFLRNFRSSLLVLLRKKKTIFLVEIFFYLFSFFFLIKVDFLDQQRIL